MDGKFVTHRKFRRNKKKRTKQQNNMKIQKKNINNNLIFISIIFIILSVFTIRGSGETEDISDRVSFLPGFGFVSNIELAGYIQLNQTTNSNSFYWFIEGNKTMGQLPIGTIVWLNGGPGCSSLIGLFEELGPYKIQEDPDNPDFPFKLIQNANSWTQSVNILFVDQPVGTGFSVSEPDGYSTSEDQLAEDFYSILCQFFTRMHPEYSPSETNPFFLVGESYAGKYIPNIATRILEGGNYRDSTGLSNVCNNLHLAGIAIGDGLVDPSIQRSSYPDEAYGVSLIGSFQYTQAQEIANKCQQDLQLGLTNYDENNCNNIGGFIHTAAGNFTTYDVRNWGEEYNENLLIEYLNSIDVQQALHISSIFNNHSYVTCSDDVFDKLKDDIFLSSKYLFNNILESGVRVLLYNGQFDYQDGPLGTERWLETLEWSGKEEFAKTERLQWIVDGKVAGYIRSYNNLSFLVVNGAGHFVPMDQPENSLDMINRFVSNFPFAADPDDVFSNKLCTFLSDCGSMLNPPQGTCVKGRCICNEGYTGLDCSYSIYGLSTAFPITDSTSLLPLSWHFYKFELINQTNLSFYVKTNDTQSDSVFSLYLNLNSVPSTNDYFISAKSNAHNNSPFIGVTLGAGVWYLGIHNDLGNAKLYSITVNDDSSFGYPSDDTEEVQKSKLSWAVAVLSVLFLLTVLILVITISYTLWKSTKTKKTYRASAWQNDL